MCCHTLLYSGVLSSMLSAPCALKCSSRHNRCHDRRAVQERTTSLANTVANYKRLSESHDADGKRLEYDADGQRCDSRPTFAEHMATAQGQLELQPLQARVEARADVELKAAQERIRVRLHLERSRHPLAHRPGASHWPCACSSRRALSAPSRQMPHELTISQCRPHYTSQRANLTSCHEAYTIL